MLGASYNNGRTRFAVWAPDHQSVDLILYGGDLAARDVRPLDRDECGYWRAEVDAAPPGTLYRYRLNQRHEQTFPDPASRFQPRGVHGPSQVIDPGAFAWTDGDWRPPVLDRMVFYELHVGTFTPEGTFAGVAARLPYLRDLGITAIELMPIGDFPGRHNWGYDGVAMFAPARCYGTPDSLRALVDAAHQHGLAVVLDVVYNHFGPDGAYATAFSPYYVSSTHTNPWGQSLNFDGPHSAEVRRFFTENARQWLRDYHIDALRLDATHAITDDSSPHFLAELSSTVRAEAGRDVILVAEDHRNIPLMLTPVGDGGYGIDAVWADDFHHQVRVHTAGDRDGYYAAFSGSAADIARTLAQGWFRGSDPSALQPPQFVLCIQNHDQVGNRVDGARLHHQIDGAVYRALSALLLLAPETPLLFMGQEWAATTPFQFFTDHHEELGRKVTEGRRAEFADFEAFTGDEDLPDPQAPETFARSRLHWDELAREPHSGMLRLYQGLLQLRRSHPALQERSRDSFSVEAADAHTVVMHRTGRDGSKATIVTRLSGVGHSAVFVAASTVLFSTEDPRFVTDPSPAGLDPSKGQITLSRPGTIVLA